MLTKIKQKISSAIHNFSSYSKILKLSIVIGLSILIYFSASLAISLQPKYITYNYDEKVCVKHKIFMPNSTKISNNSMFDVVNNKYISLAGIDILSNETCIYPISAPSEGQYEVSQSFAFGLLQVKIYEIIVKSAPVLNYSVVSQDPIAINSYLNIPISSVDELFEYKLSIGAKSVSCSYNNNNISCGLDELLLDNDTEYSFVLTKSFNNESPETVLISTLKTRSKLILESSSIIDDQVIYNNLENINLVFNKTIDGATIELEDSNNTKIDIAVDIIESTHEVLVYLKNDLKRNETYSLKLTQVIADDGSSLNNVVTITFKTSDGPTFKSSNTSEYGSPLSNTIILTFDQALSTTQNIKNYVNVTGAISTIWSKDNKIYINYNNTQKCLDITIDVKSGLKSLYEYPQVKSWKFSTRTTCQSFSSIGSSVNGRAINAYSYGSGNQVILFTASIHGNEYSTKYLMSDWMNELEKNYYNIPNNKKVVVIPTLNPDGNVTGSRYNANNIDLNRNFPSYDWQTDIYSVSNQPLAGGGGIQPLSEPESQAIADYIESTSPKLVMSYHSAAGYTIANLANNSPALASMYSNLTGYRNMTGVSSAFSYPITGTFDDWLRDKLNVTSVLIELTNNSTSEFSRNREALWAMVNS